VRDLARALAELPSTPCHPLTMSLEPAGTGATLVAQARDGARAVRAVAQPSLLVPIALGLVISIPQEQTPKATATEPSANPPPPSPANEAAPLATTPSGATPPPVAIAGPRAVAIWLGLALGARMGVPSTVSMAEVEGRVDLRFERLLLFVSFRNVPVGFVAGQGFDGDAYHESSIAFGVGRSVSLGPFSVDVAVAPSLVTMRLSKDAPVHARANDVELRVGALARLNAPLSPNWRLTLALDTDVIPDFLRTAERIDPLPAFPSWTSGLCLGVSGAVL
jgi:hypothetical protein